MSNHTATTTDETEIQRIDREWQAERESYLELIGSKRVEPDPFVYLVCMIIGPVTIGAFLFVLMVNWKMDLLHIGTAGFVTAFMVLMFVACFFRLRNALAFRKARKGYETRRRKLR